MKIKLDILSSTATNPPAEIEPMIRALCNTINVDCSPVSEDGFYTVAGDDRRVTAVCQIINALTATCGTGFEVIEGGGVSDGKNNISNAGCD